MPLPNTLVIPNARNQSSGGAAPPIPPDPPPSRNSYEIFWPGLPSMEGIDWPGQSEPLNWPGI